MRRLLLVLVVAALLLGAAFVYLAPASLLATRVERATGGTLAARQVEGTVWRGRGVLAAGDTQLPIAWTVEPESLLQGELHAHIGAYDGMGLVPRADVLAGRDRISLHDVDLTLPLPLLVQAVGGRLAQRVGLVADGDLAIRSTELEWLPPAVNGDLTVVWRGARFTLPTQAPLELGEVTATLVADGQRLAGPIENSGGVMDVRGDVAVRGDRSATLSLLLTPRRADDAALARALATVGTAEGSGWRVNWQTPPQ
jgi:hypothetical protein